MQHSAEQHRKHVALWAAVGGTAAVIAALWLLVLPMQLDRQKQAGGQRASRWGTVEDDTPKGEKTFTEIIEEQKLQLEQLDAERETTPEGEASANGPADLLTEIEAATVAKSVN